MGGYPFRLALVFVSRSCVFPGIDRTHLPSIIHNSRDCSDPFLHRQSSRSSSMGSQVRVEAKHTCRVSSPFRQSVEVETEMTAVERVLEYCALNQEPPAQVPLKERPSSDWPSHGQIVFDHVSMSYSDAEDSPLVLQNISLTIEGGEKIGIVGRTGAGKSSFIQILFRMGYLVHGQILIDQINIETVGLDDVRSHLSIIPQDPVLFTGSMRSNLDPFNHYSDEQIWHALEQVRQKIRRSLSHWLIALGAIEISRQWCDGRWTRFNGQWGWF